ncbi:MAG TPA: hypothetical protein PLE45_10725 [Spirochaetota bacterium]|nr:hypothetical protein [Spirochaetota bacterium]HOL57644.1 hypothetical protein [Spirochaetota bacterium]HPP05198.1 hypothetical protein [Spirochaetota bacterium]
MIVEIIKDILEQYRNSISLEKLEEILASKNIKSPIYEIINHSSLFSVSNGLVFIKSSLFEQKESFFLEFEDYLKTKVQNTKLCDDIINNFKFITPDIFIIEWMNASLERKIYIFDFLYNLIIKPKRIKDRLKKYFNDLIDFYTLITAYSLIFIKIDEENIDEKTVLFFKEIEKGENILKSHIFNLLTIPDVIQTKINEWEKEFKDIKVKINFILEESFYEVVKYSTALLKRVIKKEINNFDISLILSRYDFKSFYDWILMISEKNSNDFYNKHNLFDDLKYL